MPPTSFIETLDLRDAFLGNELTRLVDLIVEQGDALLRAAGLSFPARAASTILLVSEYSYVSTADIARELSQPHQLAAQRVEMLMALGLLKRQNDPEDARRKIITLTSKGKREAALLQVTLGEVQYAVQELYEEVETDLTAAAMRAYAALEAKSLVERVKTNARGVKRTDANTSRKMKHGRASV